MIDAEQRQGMLAVAACAVLWSTGGIFIKLVNWHPLAIAGIRSLIAAVVILAVLKRPKITFSLPQIFAAVFHAGTMMLFVAATRSTTAANAIILQFTAPIYVAILGWGMLGEKPAVHHWAALAAAAAGMVLFFQDELAPGFLAGNLMAAGSGVTFAMFSIFMRRQKDGSPLESMLLSNILVALIGLPFYGRGPAPDVVGWVSVACLGLFQTGVALLLFTRGIRRITALSAMLIAILEPLLNPLWVLIFTGEKPGPWALVGGSVILVSVTASSVVSIGAVDRIVLRFSRK
jgi:drug/metabolite transporter (DMT)-like permease